jgi:DNA-binding transcriptional MerR regulator
MEEKLFKIGEMAKRLDVTKRTLTHYMEKGLIVPAMKPKSPGMLNKFSEKNFYDVLLIQELTKNGFDLETVKQIVQHLFAKARIKGAGNEALVIYDGHTDSGSVKRTAFDKKGNLKLDMSGRKSATVIDITELRDKAATLVA